MRCRFGWRFRSLGPVMLLLGALAACDDATGGAPPDDDPDAGDRTDGATPPDGAPIRDAAREPTPDAGPAPGPDGAPDPDSDAAPAADAAVPDPLPDAAPPLPAPDAAPAAGPPVRVETRLGVPSTPAGRANRVTCQALDATGASVEGIATRFEVRPADGWRPGGEGEIVGGRAGTYAVTCTAGELGLRDDSPARWDVMPGPAALVGATVDLPRPRAGEEVSVNCWARDAEGNPLDAVDAAVTVTPVIAGNELQGRRARLIVSGRYRVDCVVPGVVETIGARVDVLPGPPFELAAALDPERPSYGPGDVIGLPAVVTDRFGNRIPDADLTWSAEPALPGFGEGRFRPSEEGRHTLGVCVSDPELPEPLCRDYEILVDAGGPAVSCLEPTRGAMLVRGPVRVVGRVADVAGIDALTVDGAPVAVDADGRFEAMVQPGWGLNTHDVVARDALGNASSTFCSYFAADGYHPEDRPLNDAVVLHLTPRAVDDGPPDRPISSLTDLVRAMVNSQALVDTIDASLRAQNPIVPNECRQRVFGVCVFSMGATYRDMRLGGPNTIALTLVQGGIRVRARLERLALDIRLNGTLSNEGTLTTDFVQAEMTFAMELVNGRPSVRLVRVDEVTVGPMDSNFSGFLTGALLDLVFWAFERQVRETVTAALRGFLETEVDALLTDILSGLDVSSFGSELPFPGLDGGPGVSVRMGFAFSAIDTTPQRMLMGIATTAAGPVREPAPSPGVALPPGPVRAVLQPAGTVAAGINIGFLNQVLHRAWRAGAFRIDSAESLLGDLPPGTSLSMRFLTPPAAVGRGNGPDVRIFLGPIQGELVYPGLFDQPLRIVLAATATAGVELAGGANIRFGGGDGIRVERLALAVEDAPVTPEGRAALERLLGRVVQAIVDESLNGALPELPIPDFELPESLAPYGIRPGTRLGLRAPRLSGSPSHWIVDGTFRE